jgi:hypothetical protein
MTSAHLHNDYSADGDFWHDWAYPPYDRRQMKAMDRVIGTCHREGIRVVPYLNPKTLHPKVEAYRRHKDAWARKPDGQTIVHNLCGDGEFGAQMCMVADGWVSFIKEYIDRLLERHDFDGFYLDRVSGCSCCNAAHGPHEHWDLPALVDFLAWCRERIGPEGLMYLHTTEATAAVTENFGDYSTNTEAWRLQSDRFPLPEDLPATADYMGGTARAVLDSNLYALHDSPALRRAFFARGVLCGYSYWCCDPVHPVVEEAYRRMKAVAFERFRFLSWARRPVRVSDRGVRAALYFNAEEAVIVLANVGSSSRRFTYALDIGDLGWKKGRQLVLRRGVRGRAVGVRPQDLKAGVRTTLGRDAFVFVTVRKQGISGASSP